MEIPITLLDKPDRERARSLLQEAIQQVMPLIRKRNWFLQRIKEFYPRPGLLGQNEGTEISIRLRDASDERRFYPPEDILGTLLHELAHMEHANHSPAFFQFLDELWDEVEGNTSIYSQGERGGFGNCPCPSSVPLSPTGFACSQDWRKTAGVRLSFSQTNAKLKPVEAARRAALRRYS